MEPIAFGESPMSTPFSAAAALARLRFRLTAHVQGFTWIASGCWRRALSLEVLLRVAPRVGAAFVPQW